MNSASPFILCTCTLKRILNILLIFFYLKWRGRENHLLTNWSLPICLIKLELAQTEGRNLDLRLGFLCGWQVPRKHTPTGCFSSRTRIGVFPSSSILTAAAPNDCPYISLLLVCKPSGWLECTITSGLCFITVYTASSGCSRILYNFLVVSGIYSDALILR